jgi:diguanylate cyclase (GGDEF)-like protein
MTTAESWFCPRTVSRSLAVFFASGTTLGELSMLVPHAPQPHEAEVRLIWAAAFPVALLLWFRGDRIRRPMLHVALAAGVTVVTAAIVVSRNSATATVAPIFYVWTIVIVATFFGIRATAGHAAFLAGSYGFALWAAGVPEFAGQWVFVAGALAATGVIVGEVVTRHRRLADTDALTGLLNRRGFDADLQRLLALSRRKQLPIAVIVIDLVGFKSVNDDFGHAAGDAVLSSTARAWRAELREVDAIARWGGDEFVVAAPECDAEAARGLVRRLISATPLVRFAYGIAEWDGEERARDLISRADRDLLLSRDSTRRR